MNRYNFNFAALRNIQPSVPGGSAIDLLLRLNCLFFLLQSKRIGHFFFWYVRSEVAGCPYFRQRMAVILEAYLMGCSQAMLDSFSQQVQAVEALQDVAIMIKNLYPDKTDLSPQGGTRPPH